MKGKRWFFLFLSAGILVTALWAGINVAVDPFNAFGDRLLDWGGYTQTLSPRNSKAVYISGHFDEYDSYIIGSSSAANYLPETLNAYLDAHFYNMFHYGADIGYDCKLVSYLLENDDVKNIFLVLGVNEIDRKGIGTEDVSIANTAYYKVSGESALSYYGKFLFADLDYAFEKISAYPKDTGFPQNFDVFLPEDGTYNKVMRDAEAIGSVEDYLAVNGGDFAALEGVKDLSYAEQCVEYVSQIKAMCSAHGANLYVVLTPVYSGQLQAYTEDSLNAFYEKLSEVTDFWNYQITPITYDPRYFYDLGHVRNAAGDMVIADIFGDDGVYRPESFGVYCTKGEVASVGALKERAEAAFTGMEKRDIPILLYHHIVQEGEQSSTALRQETFAHQMQLLKDNGYAAVSFEDIIAYVERGTPLPEKAVIITFDDGYLSNYELAYPILREMDYPATIFVIGCSLGHYQYYKDTEYELTPHFGASEAEEMLRSGLISIESHTFDMHQWTPFETGERVRADILPFADESDGAYIAALERDIESQNALLAAYGIKSTVLAFPEGKHIQMSDAVLRNNGYKATVTTDEERVNTLVQGLPQSLFDLGRMTVSGDTTDEELLRYVSGG